MKFRNGRSRLFPLGKEKENKGSRQAGLKLIDLSDLEDQHWVDYWDDLPKSPAVKNVSDRILALVLVLFLLPLIGLVALTIRFTSSGPVIYRQVRIGMNRRTTLRSTGRAGAYYDVYDRRTLDLPGRPFIIYKFRTMIDGAENAAGPVWAQKDDPRVTALGRILRKLRIDEIPQLFNVLKGDMSMIGPRPERPTFVRDLVGELPEYAIRLRVKPGITGLAQVEQEYDTCLEDVKSKLRYDLDYIRDLSLWNDMKIIVRTVGVVLSMKGT